MSEDRTLEPSEEPNGEAVGAENGAEAQRHLAVVGIGASAGGLRALQTFFGALPAETGLAYVVVQHLDPSHESELAEILQRSTEMPVRQIADAPEVEPDHVYVIPPGKTLGITDGGLRLTDAERERGQRAASIDTFFRSLAADQGERAACVVLSGTGTDGTLGLKTLKEAGGLTMAQDPAEADYDGMPRSAVATGLVDVVLPAAELAQKLVALRHTPIPAAADDLEEDDDEAVTKILTQLRAGTGHDFARYKQSTVLRRIGQRIQVLGLDGLPGYLRALRKQPAEQQALFKDLLISVTSFFRDPEAFEVLDRDVIPKLFEGKGPQDAVRVWVCGCATGEEAYSIAMLLCEHAAGLDDAEGAPELQVFATDLDADAVRFAREGLYPEVAAADIPPDRLKQHFVREGEGYRVKEAVRDIVLFAVHNVLEDPPFSKLDLVTCRNLLIYLQRPAQERVFETFAYGLRSGGYLFLGSSEAVEGTRDLFTTLDKRHRLFKSRGVVLAGLRLPTGRARPSATAPGADNGEQKVSLGELHRQRLLRAYTPASVIVGRDHEILHLHGDLGPYLRLPAGDPTLDLLQVARPELRPELRTALFYAAQRGTPTEGQRVALDAEGGGPESVTLTVRPLTEPEEAEGLLQVVFEEAPAGPVVVAPSAPADADALQHLGEELQQAKRRLRATIEEYETSTEELRASNEELLSMNDELQSTTEELETGREELQSMNEELRPSTRSSRTRSRSSTAPTPTSPTSSTPPASPRSSSTGTSGSPGSRPPSPTSSTSSPRTRAGPWTTSPAASTTPSSPRTPPASSAASPPSSARSRGRTGGGSSRGPSRTARSTTASTAS